VGSSKIKKQKTPHRNYLLPVFNTFQRVNNPTRCALCDTMIGRADIEGSKSNVAKNARLPQVSSLLPDYCAHLLAQSESPAFFNGAGALSGGSGLYLKQRQASTHCRLVSELHPPAGPKDLAADYPLLHLHRCYPIRGHYPGHRGLSAAAW
jgi:hypothetical protein